MSVIKNILRLICVISITCSLAEIIKLPQEFPICHKNNPNLSECLLAATEELRPLLSQGIPELKIPPLSIFKIPEISLQIGDPGNAIHYKSLLNNISVWGLDQYHFSIFNVDFKNETIYAEVVMSHIHMLGKYQSRGQILVAPIEGKGDFFNNVTNTHGTLQLNFKLMERNSKKYMEPYDTKFKVTKIGEITSYGITGLFGGHREIAEATTKVINDNLKELAEDLVPVTQQVMTTIFQEVIFKNIARIPLDVLFRE